MANNTNKIMPVKNHPDKTDVKKIKLNDTQQRLFNSNADIDDSQNPYFVNLCTEKVAKGCDEKNMQIFKGLSEKGL